MAKEKTSSQPQQTAPAHPFAAFGIDAFAQLTKDSVERINALYGELAQVEARAYDRMRDALAEAETMQRELSEYVQTLAGEWRKLALETTKRTVDMWSGAKA